MRNAKLQGRIFLTLTALTLLPACSPDQHLTAPDKALKATREIDDAVAESDGSSAPLVRHVVAPLATDPAIDQALDNHYVWLDTTVRSNHKLFVFLPGGRQRPAMFQLLPREAARLGYHVIGLMYPNSVQFAAVCPGVPDPNACYENGRLEIVDGVDRTDIVDVNQANSIDNRLTKLLEYLSVQYPEEGWSRFLADDKPKWSQIAVSGHSQGGGEAAMIAKIHVVARVVLFSSVVDRIGTQAAPWSATHMTPSERYWGLAHDRDGNFPSIRASWDSIGMAPFGPEFIAPEASEPPYGLTHMLVTEVVPIGGFVGTNAHGSPSNDANTPLRPDGTPILREAWRYLLTARSASEDIAERDRVTAPNKAVSAAREIDDVGAEVGDEVRWSAWSPPRNLGPTINSDSLEQHPAISKDGLSLYFASNRAGGLGGVDIYVSQRESLDAPWGTPVNLGTNINSGRNESAPTFSLDGHSMYFHSGGRGGCGGADLFVSHRRDKRDDFGWEKAQNLGCVVNSPSADNGPTIFEDDATGITTLYFNSTRPGGLGDADIYASTRTGDEGSFGKAVLVRELSSPSRDTRTAISRDGLEMFLSSGRDGGIGSEDIWVSTRPTTLDRWSTPVNLGRPVNTADFDGGPALSFDGTTLYFHSDRQGPPGNYDIWVTTRTRVHK